MQGIIRAIHNLGIALWWGGTFMGTLAMNPAVEVLDDPDERDKMVDEGWALFQPWAASGLLSAIITHIILRRKGPKNASRSYKWIARVKDALFGAAVATTLTNMAMGEYAIEEDDAMDYLEATPDAPHEFTPETDDNMRFAAGQQKLTPAAYAQLLTGVALFAAGAFLAANHKE